MSRRRPQAHSHAPIQPADGSYIGSSVREALICVGIWAISTFVYISGLRLWNNHAYPGEGVSINQLAVYLGIILGQSVLMAVYLSVVVFYRKRNNVTSFILLDWRWWVGVVIFSVLLKNPPPAWLWVGLIYQVRLWMKRKSLSSTTPIKA
jgi:hypothetical protein